MTTPMSERETSRYAILGFVWALMSLSIPIPFVISIVALLYCRAAKDHILGSSGRYRGQELTHAAKALAMFTLWIWIILFVAALVIVLVALYFGT